MKYKVALFDIKSVQLSADYVSPQEKRLWTTSFVKWADNEYTIHGERNGTFCCGYMGICDLCKMKKLQGCADCVETIKEWYRSRKKPIPYKNYDFAKIVEEVEKGIEDYVRGLIK